MTSTEPRALAVFAGASARAVLAREGWQPGLFQTMVGASGGAKFLALAELDKHLFGDYLQQSQHPMHLIGSSIGSWRHAALTQPEPVVALEALQNSYIQQYYDENVKATPALVSAVSKGIMDSFMGADGASNLCGHKRFRSHVVTARGRGPTASQAAWLQALGLGLAAVSNTLHRGAMQPWFQRVVFSSGDSAAHGFNFSDFATSHQLLTPANTAAALHASGSIPFVLTGERDIPGAQPGQYWDGGIIDYHFNFADYQGEGLVLYPHFRADITPGWFDKFLPWRRARAAILDKVVLLCPGDDYVTRLPHGKIPDRRDFLTMSHDQRIEYWHTTVQASVALAEEFQQLVTAADPLAHVQAF